MPASALPPFYSADAGCAACHRMIHRFYHTGGSAAQRPAGAGFVDAKPGRQLGDAQRLLADFNHQMDLQRRKREPLLCLFNMPNSLTKLRANA